jgi:hypothetical protein
MGKGTGTCNERVSLQLSEAKPLASNARLQLNTSSSSHTKSKRYTALENNPSEPGQSTQFSNRSKPVIDKYGTKRWHNERGEKHRVNGPAKEHANGEKEWWLNGKRHRENGPARELANGAKLWYLNGQLHREDGPAIEWAKGNKEWWLKGKLHREDGPAIELANEGKYWYQNGELHRVGAPAIEQLNGVKEWYLNGRYIKTDQ